MKISKKELEPSPIHQTAGLVLLAIALVILPTALTDKRVSLKPVNVGIELNQLESSVEAVSLEETPNTEIVPESSPEPPQEPVEPEVVQTPPPVEKPVTEPPKPVSKPITGTKADWLAQSDIPRKDWELVDWLVSRESSWNPSAQNPRSTAFGLKQFLDGTWAGVGCTKAEAIGNPVYQLNCGQKYVMARYGSWQAANAFWRANKWY